MLINALSVVVSEYTGYSHCRTRGHADRADAEQRGRGPSLGRHAGSLAASRQRARTKLAVERDGRTMRNNPLFLLLLGACDAPPDIDSIGHWDDGGMFKYEAWRDGALADSAQSTDAAANLGHGGTGEFSVCDECVGGDLALRDASHDNRICGQDIDDPSCLTPCGGDETLRCIYGRCQRLYASEAEVRKFCDEDTCAFFTYGPDGRFAPETHGRTLVVRDCEQAP